MKTIPEGVVEIRRDLCPECDAIAHDPCASCVHGHWGPYVRCDPDLPPPVAMAANLAKAAGAEAVAHMQGLPAPAPEEIASRLAICETCDHFRASDERCSKCGCFLKFKTAWRSQHCPIGKW
jgi:hypothetical protein